MKKTVLKFNLPVFILHEDKKFIAYTPVLDLSTSGKSDKEARKRFGEIVNIFFEELIRKNTLDETLHDLGWKRRRTKGYGPEWMPPVVVSQESQTVKVPVK